MSDPRITDEVVEVARRAREDVIRAIDRASDGTDWPDPMRAALEAVLPDRGDVLQALTEVYEGGAMGGEWPTLGADAVMDLITGTES